MSNTQSTQPDGEREVSSSSNTNLDRLLYERHFRNSPVNQINTDINYIDTSTSNRQNETTNTITTNVINEPITSMTTNETSHQ